MKTKHWFALIGSLALPMLFGCAEVSTPPPTVMAPPPPVAPQPDPPAVATPTPLAPAAGEVVTLAQSGSSQDVILAYIQNSPTAFNLTADQILYLRDIGVTSQAITAMLNRDSALHAQSQTYVYNQVAYPPTVAPPAPLPETVPPAPVAETAPPAPVAVTAPASAETPAPVYVSSPPPDVTYFYNDLSPYGTWVQIDSIGWCWQPRVVVVNQGWRPYCDGGHWAWTDAGWFWASDYSWGWAPFHYGRWYLHDRCGWVWLPDRTWGPAWVTWRVAGDQCGWAPLPPHAVFDAHLGWAFNGVHVGVNFDFGLHPDHFTFVAMHDFNAHDVGHRRLAPTEVTKVYNHTTIVNNYVVNNNVIVNQGVRVENVAAATHTQIHKVDIRDVPADSVRSLPAHGSGANATVVYRSELKTPSATAPAHMTAQKMDDRHPVIQHPPVAPATAQPRNAGNHPAPAPARQWTTESQPTPPQPAASHTPSPGPAYSLPKAYQATTQPPPHTQVAPQAANTPEQATHSATPNPTRPATSSTVASHGSTTVNPSSATPTHSTQQQPMPPTHNAAPYQPAATAASHPGMGTSYSSAPPTHLSQQQPVPPTHTTSAYQPGSNSRPGPAPSPAPTAPGPASPHMADARPSANPPSDSPGNSHSVSHGNAAQNQNPHGYPPKSAQQAAEAHALPPLNPHQ